MVIFCNKCNAEFATNNNLQRHLNKKVPCDKPLKCGRCNKTFTRNDIYQTHLNRKYPCKSKDDKDKNNEIKLIELKIKNDRIEERKARNASDNATKLKLAEDKMALEKQKIDAQIKLAEIKSNDSKDREKTKREIEKAKERRQTERTNNIHVTKNVQVHINNLTIMNLENEYLRSNRQNMSNIEKLINHAIEKVTVRPDDPEDIVEKKERNKEKILDIAGNPKGIFELIIRDTFKKNDKKHTFIFYDEKNDRYYGIYQIDSEKSIQVIDFQNELSPIFRKVMDDTLLVIFSELKQFCIKNNLDLSSGERKTKHPIITDKTVADLIGKKGYKYSLIKLIVCSDEPLTDDYIKQCSDNIFKFEFKNIKSIQDNQNFIIKENKALKECLLIEDNIKNDPDELDWEF
jgi:uncharacterized C2H2 Zn-finger protein